MKLIIDVKNNATISLKKIHYPKSYVILKYIYI